MKNIYLYDRVGTRGRAADFGCREGAGTEFALSGRDGAGTEFVLPDLDEVGRGQNLRPSAGTRVDL